MTLDDVIVEAIALRQKTEGGDLTAAYAAMERDLAQLSRELDVTTLLPGGPDAALGMAAKEKNAKRFYAVFKKRIRANLCDGDGEFAKLIRAGVQGSVGAIVTALAAALSLPAAALTILVPLAVIISHSGLEAFCEVTEEGD
jgi:hypothetical protein